ncbi:Outer membrane porin F [Polaribacter huanghezhanensis]|uniref:OmpA family protein n=1 Tax=Polaribacter huanghezhanensis TaxID=1354726 RepID=UPI00264908E9|nr:OmpA family protein [Polaribacter huanghezhanensis]WKD85585.1 Outer membrane porin F [Polaribacter huanghezhanensis]
MKHLKIAMIALFTFVMVANVNAQDSDNPWAITLGFNSVDIRGGKSISTLAKDYLGTKDWNTLPSVSRIAATKYLQDGFSLQLAGSLNKIDNVNGVAANMMYYAFDANVLYDVNKLVELTFGSTTKLFDPYVYLGGGYTSIGGNGEGMMNAGAGFNVWLNENIGINLQSGAKRNFSGEVADHFQHTFGIILKFGGKDTDGDGVYDKNDSCPDVAGLAAFNGCPDADGDGIQDSKDSCPDVAGLAALNGCPDADGDGIADKDDMCPNEKGSAANRGCPDSDGDGVVNKDDKCPNVAGPAANGGCPWPDTDGDGVLDKDDNCVNEAGPASNNGCPEPIITDAAVQTINMGAKFILFNTGKHSFKSGVTKKLDDIIAIMNEFPKATFVVEGHTDSSGGAALNLRISEKRAMAVRDYFVKKGISTDRLEAKGFGEGSPIANNKTRAGRAENRRVEIKVANNN